MICSPKEKRGYIDDRYVSGYGADAMVQTVTRTKKVEFSACTIERGLKANHSYVDLKISLRLALERLCMSAVVNEAEENSK